MIVVPLQVAADAELTIGRMFVEASFIVQLVMLALIAASIWVWAITFSKIKMYRRARANAAAFDGAFWSGEPLDELYDQVAEAPGSASERVFVAGMTEWRRSLRDDGALIPGVQQRVDRSMDVAITREGSRLTHGLTFLATVGATAPFVGLFGTVWGIMRSFQEIAGSGQTSLAVVAPGIAEALLATALGLLAAIPAVMLYNKLSSDADEIVGTFESFADEFSTLLSRQLD